MPSQIMRDLAAAGGMTDMDGVFQVEMRGQSRQIVGIMVHIMAVASLGRAAMAAAVMGDDAIAMIEKEQQLRVPLIGRQRPAVAEHDRLARAPVLVKDLRAVSGGNGGHVTSCERVAAVPIRAHQSYRRRSISPAASYTELLR